MADHVKHHHEVQEDGRRPPPRGEQSMDHARVRPRGVVLPETGLAVVEQSPQLAHILEEHEPHRISYGTRILG